MTPSTSLLAHPDVARLARRLVASPGRAAEITGTVRRAAVALILRADDRAALELLLIKRAEYTGDPWSGHVAFPGGRQEPGDASLEETATRETLEETGIAIRRDGQILGTLDELYPRTPALPPIVVRPYVAVVSPDVAIVPSAEVASAFWVPVATLRDPAVSVEATVTVRGEERRVSSFRHGNHTVWGLTERILRQFLGLLE